MNCWGRPLPGLKSFSRSFCLLEATCTYPWVLEEASVESCVLDVRMVAKHRPHVHCLPQLTVSGTLLQLTLNSDGFPVRYAMFIAG